MVVLTVWLAIMARLALAGSRVRGDEIAREQPSEEAGGEGVVIHILLALQLAHGVGVLAGGKGARVRPEATP